MTVLRIPLKLLLMSRMQMSLKTPLITLSRTITSKTQAPLLFLKRPKTIWTIVIQRGPQVPVTKRMAPRVVSRWRNRKCLNSREMSENTQFLDRTLSMLLNPATPRGIRSPSYALASKESPLISSKGLGPTMMQPGITWIPFMATRVSYRNARYS